jgi:ATP-dependent RNA helicase DeaD
MPVCKTLSPASQPHQRDADSAAPVERFSDLDLSEIMLASLALAEYDQPTPVQTGIIPRALAGIDVLGQARTGTGKTAAFAIPILERLEHGRKGASPQALVLVPTRELAVQVREEFGKLAHGRRTSCVPVYGGKPIRGQISKLQQGADVVVGTPGRVLDLIGRGALDLRTIRTVVLDEADRMLDIGFRPDIEKILRRCPSERQTLLLSATVAPPVERLARKYMREPEVLDFSSQTMTVDTIEQSYFTVDHEQKYDLLVRLLKREKPEQAIVFCRTKRGTDRVFRKLSKQFEGVDAIHGDMVQTARDSVMKRFRAGEVHILVATDVVGRGIDVTSISHIINYDIPQSSDDYVHRVGRTGRMGRDGIAFTFVTTEEGGELTRIEMLINRLLKRDEIEGFAAVASVAPRAAPAPAAGTDDAADSAESDPTEDGVEAPPEPRKANPPGQRPRRRHRRGL